MKTEPISLEAPAPRPGYAQRWVARGVALHGWSPRRQSGGLSTQRTTLILVESLCSSE